MIRHGLSTAQILCSSTIDSAISTLNLCAVVECRNLSYPCRLVQHSVAQPPNKSGWVTGDIEEEKMCSEPAVQLLGKNWRK
jgi:hypothetical protein